MKNLVIVESPAKATTIKKYLDGSFVVMSSVGHIRSIAKKTKTGEPPIDTKNGFKTVYEVDPDKRKIIADLKKAAKEAEIVWMATDEDREGEAIAWHLCEVLKLDPRTTKRIVFHEITKSAIEAAIKNPRTVDMQLVQAQQARQILDRLVGFEISPVVWQKVPGGKSAGRVQSPALRLLVEREREIEAFESGASFKVTAEFNHDRQSFKAELGQKFETEDQAKKFLEDLLDANFTVADITTSPAVRNPAAPFTTSTLQQEANSRLGFSAKATMASAQKLYQDGKITYMRTDSVILSREAIAAASTYIKDSLGEKYVKVRNFQTKSLSAQEAHEAIRPTDVRLEHAGRDQYDQKLYDLIRKRTLASQMAPAKLEKTVITVSIVRASGSADKINFEAKGEVILFDGFLKIYGTKKEDSVLPQVQIDDSLNLTSAEARQMFSRPPARYTEGGLVKKLEELGIGRPSTYATIIETLQTRDYANKGENDGTPREIITLRLEDKAVNREIVEEKTGTNKGKLIPTPAGRILSDFLVEHFEQIVDYGFTAKVETEFDQIAIGSLARNVMLEKFYASFSKLIEKTGDIDRRSVSQTREIGTDPKTNQPIFARFGRYGPMLQLGSAEDKDNPPRFASMPDGQNIETITLEEALHAFTLPRTVGKTPDGKEIKANVGRFGPYIQVDKLFVNIAPLDPRTITLAQAVEAYDAKVKSEAEKTIADFGGGVKVLKGRFGPYVTNGKKNAKIDKNTDPTTITQEVAEQLLKEAPDKKRRPYNKRSGRKHKA